MTRAEIRQLRRKLLTIMNVEGWESIPILKRRAYAIGKMMYNPNKGILSKHIKYATTSVQLQIIFPDGTSKYYESIAACYRDIGIRRETVIKNLDTDCYDSKGRLFYSITEKEFVSKTRFNLQSA